MKHRLYLFAAVGALLVGGCTPKGAPMRRTCLYAAVDTTKQQPLAYVVEGEQLFPYVKFVERSRPQETTDIRDGYCYAVFETDRPTVVSVMPVRDSTAALTVSSTFVVSPGDSLEVRTATDPRITAFKVVKAELVETEYRDNAYAELVATAFPYQTQPKFANDDPIAYKRDVEDYYDRQCAFLDSCRRAMPLSERCIAQAKSLYALLRYNRLSAVLQQHPDLELPADYLGDGELPEAGYGTAAYAHALLNKYIRNVSREPERHYAAIERGIRRAPRRLRDYLTALQIGYFAELQLPSYAGELAATVERAERTIRDTVLRGYVARAKAFYAERHIVLPDSVLHGTRFETLAGEELTLAELLARHAGQPVFLDFWASWCSGCILDMERSANAEAYLKEQGIACLYVSIDEDAESWRRACDRHDVRRDSYRCLGHRDSPLVRLLRVTSIPRYVLFDGGHEIVCSNAPRPTSDGLPALKSLVEQLCPNGRGTVFGD